MTLFTTGDIYHYDGTIVPYAATLAEKGGPREAAKTLLGALTMTTVQESENGYMAVRLAPDATPGELAMRFAGAPGITVEVKDMVHPEGPKLLGDDVVDAIAYEHRKSLERE